MNIIGRGRYARATYPERSPRLAAPFARFALDQTSNAFSQIDGAPPIQIATATINVAPGSRIKVEAVAVVLGSVASGAAVLFTLAIPSVVAIQSFGIAQDSDTRTCNYLGVTAPQLGGSVTVSIDIGVSGATGARVDNIGVTVLTLTEIPASSGP